MWLAPCFFISSVTDLRYNFFVLPGLLFLWGFHLGLSRDIGGWFPESMSTCTLMVCRDGYSVRGYCPLYFMVRFVPYCMPFTMHIRAYVLAFVCDGRVRKCVGMFSVCYCFISRV